MERDVARRNDCLWKHSVIMVNWLWLSLLPPIKKMGIGPS